jgi:hypothetical protein
MGNPAELRSLDGTLRLPSDPAPQYLVLKAADATRLKVSGRKVRNGAE